MQRVSIAVLVGLVWMVAGRANADSVHLVGGSVIEGKAIRQGDKVIVELSGGQIAVDAESVERIERSESDVDRFERRYAALGKSDVAARVALADFCRDRGLREREERLLREVIEISPDHHEARTRLGFVRDRDTWISREEHARAQGLVEYEGRFISRAEQLELERLRAETAQAAHARERAALELQARRAELEASKRAAESPPEPPPSSSTTIIVGGYPYPYPHPQLPPPRQRRPSFHPPASMHSTCGAPPCPDQRPRQPRFVPYIRDPSEYF
jgi:hypothetical protein